MIKHSAALVFCMMLMYSSRSSAQPVDWQAHLDTPSPITVSCMQKISMATKVPMAIIAAFLRVQNGRLGDIVQSEKGDQLLGVMHLNKKVAVARIKHNLPALNLSDAQLEKLIKNDSCLNVTLFISDFAEQLNNNNGNMRLAVAHEGSLSGNNPEVYVNWFRSVFSSMYSVGE